MKIAILDNENARVIVSEVPAYLADANASSDDIASAILIALGLPVDTEYMIGNIETRVFTSAVDSFAGNGLEGLTQDFKEDALEALKDLTD